MNNEQGNSIPLVSIGIPVKDGFKNKSEDDINLSKYFNFINNK